MRNLSLRARLNVLLGALLFLSLLVNIGLIIWHAGPRIRAENVSDEKLARGLIYTVLASLQEAPDPGPPLRRLVSDLQNLRHVRIFFVTNETQAQAAPVVTYANSADRPPRWFIRLFVPQPRLSIIPVVLNGRNFGTIAIASDPTQEVSEIWTELWSIVLTALLFGICVLVLMMIFVGRALAPIGLVGQAITKLAGGDTGVKLAPRGPPEFVDIGTKINGLADNLAHVSAENQRLIHQLVKVQEDERSQIARDLHDEMGPHLFCIRANVSALREKMSEPARVNQTVGAIGEQAEAIQITLRRLLQRLRPAGLEELGLTEALRTLVDSWRAAHPELEISLYASEDFSSVNENIGLAVYRVIQEGLTNVFRHAGATKASVTVDYVADPRQAKTLRARVEDDGVGMPETFQKGLGLTGMGERVRACGGHLNVTRCRGRGTLVEAIFPLAHAEDLVEAT